jgi:hypothetical protein
LDLVAVANADSFKALESGTQAIITSVFQHSSDFEATIVAQTADIREFHHEGRGISEKQHQIVVHAIEDVIQTSNAHVAGEHEKARKEVSQLKDEAAKLKQDMKREFAALELIKTTAEANGDKEKNNLKERINATSASFLAKDIKYSDLMVCFTNAEFETRADKCRLGWPETRPHK